MSIVFASDLSAADLALLGTNLLRPNPGFRSRRIPDRRRRERVVAAVNRSLAAHRERVDRLYPVVFPAAAPSPRTSTCLAGLPA